MHEASQSRHADPFDGLLLATVHVYVPFILPVTFRVWIYSAVVALTNRLSVVPWVTVVESLVQVTLVAGPPVDTQERLN